MIHCSLVFLLVAAVAPDTTLIDSFDSVTQWTTNPAAGVEITIHPDNGLHGRAMRVDFDFHGHPGYGIVRRELKLDLPSNYEFSFALRGEAPTNTLEFKLVDQTNANVWWSNNPNFDFPRQWRTISRQRRQICFAWGPSARDDIRHVAAIELAITAGTGGKGSVWIDDLSLTALDPDSPFAATAPVASTPIVGTWESADKQPDASGLKADFGADGSFRSIIGIMATFNYTAPNGRLTVDFGDPRAKFDNTTVSYRIENGTYVQNGVNLLGSNITMKQVGPGTTDGAPILGVWSFVDYTGVTAFVDFDEKGNGYLRIPMRMCSGKWSESRSGHLAIMLNGQLNERDYSIDNDVLTLKAPGGDIKYNRRTH
jgi:hypothetical protein